MGVFNSIVDFDQLFHNSTQQPIIVNDISTATENERKYLDWLIAQRFETDLLSNEPSCDCGMIKGGYKIGYRCTNCGTMVAEVFDKELQPIIWLRAPKGVAAMMNPTIINQLSAKFTKSSFNLIEWLCNTDYTTPYNKPIETAELESLGVLRGYNNFVNNFDFYIECLFSLKTFREKKGKENELYLELKKFRQQIFSHYIPVPNKAVMVIEDTQVGTYVDPIIVGAIDAIRTISSIDTPLANFSIRQRENKTAKSLFMLANFYQELYSSLFSGKPGLFRKQIFGGRNHFSARPVISSITTEHNYSDLYISWSIGVTLFYLHLMSKMLNRGWLPNDATAKIHQATYAYDEYIDSLFKELIDESPDKGIWCIFQRNPSLKRGSAQRFKITLVKTDVDDPTISMSILVVKSPNADFDGKLVAFVKLL